MADISPRPQINAPRRVQDVPIPATFPPASSSAPAPSSGPAPAPAPSPAPVSPAQPPQAEIVEISPPANDLDTRLREMLTAETERDKDKAPNLVSITGAVPTADGLLTARNDLELRAREAAKMVRLVDRQRQQLERAEQDLEAMQEKLAQLLPTVTETTAALKVAMRQTRRGDEVQVLGDQFNRSGAAFDELETLVGNLSAQLLWTRSTWEQYCKSVAACQRLRAS